ncbi:MAG: TolC family protein, partial [Gemmatimonadota bacterium]|nr:TolC family protein [Gemmatimonadota bacterium]
MPTIPLPAHPDTPHCLMNRLFVAGLALAAALPLGAQEPITLAGALRRADSLAYANRLARASALVSHAAALAPLKGVLPSVQLDAGYMQTTDPIGAFGTILRQRSATPASFDPHALDFPAAARDYSGDVTVSAPLINPDAWIGRRAAVTAARSADAGADWTRETTRADVVRAYFGAALSAAQVAALDSAAAAAHAHVRAAQSM